MASSTALRQQLEDMLIIADPAAMKREAISTARNKGP